MKKVHFFINWLVLVYLILINSIGCSYTILKREQEEPDSLKRLESQNVVTDTTSGFYFPLHLGNVWVYYIEGFVPGYDTVRVDSAITLGERQYYHLNQSIPVWVSYKRKFETNYWITTDEVGNVYALVDSEERPLMLFNQNKVNKENYFGWDEVLWGTWLILPGKKITERDRFCSDGVMVSYTHPAQRGREWIFCKGVGLVYFEEYDHGMEYRRTLISYKIESQQ